MALDGVKVEEDIDSVDEAEVKVSEELQEIRLADPLSDDVLFCA